MPHSHRLDQKREASPAKGHRFSRELLRKGFHLCALGVPALYYALPIHIVLILLASWVVLSLGFDILRSMHKGVRQLVQRLLSPLFRPHELASARIALSGMSYFALGAFLTGCCFSQPITILSLLVLVFADTAAALLGMRFGKTRLPNGKSVAGTIAFTCTAYLVCAAAIPVLISPAQHAPYLVSAALAAYMTALIELLFPSHTLDDNLTIPLSFASVMQLSLYWIH